MRFLLLALLILLPFGVATFLFLRRDEPAERGAIRIDRRTAPPRSDGDTDELVGTSGRGLFVVSTSKATIGYETHDYPNRYFWLDEFVKTAAGEVRAKGVLMVVNPAPNSAADLAGLLRLQVTEDAEHRRLALEAATADHTFVRADHGVFRGGNTVDDAEGVHLEDGVQFRLQRARGSLPLSIDTGLADVDFRAGRLFGLALPESFHAASAEINVHGEGLTARSGAAKITIKRNVRVERGIDVPGGGITISAGGPVSFMPDRSAGGDLLSILGADAGDVDLEGRAVIESRFGTLSADRLRFRLLPKFKDNPDHPRLKDVQLDGNVVFESTLGLLRGEKAEWDFDGPSAGTLTLHGKPADIQWRRPGDAEPFVTATSNGPAVAFFSRDETGAATLVIGLSGGVDLKAPSLRGGTALRSERAKFRFDRGPASDPEARYEIRSLIAEGNVTGNAGEIDFKAATAGIDRTPRESGEMELDLVLIGPARVGRGATGDSVETLTVTADERIVFDESLDNGTTKITAAGNAVVLRTADGVLDRFNADRISTTIPKDTGSRLLSIDVSGAATGVYGGRFDVSGDSATIDRRLGVIAIHGTPARLIDRAQDDETQFVSARSITYRDAVRTIVAEGAVEGTLAMDDPVIHFSGTDTRRPPSPFDPPAQPGEGASTFRCEHLTLVLFESRKAAPEPDATTTVQHGVSDVSMTGGVILATPTKTIHADLVRYNARIRQGRVEGSPLHVRVHHKRGDVEWTDELDARVLAFDDSYRLLEGAPRIRLHLVKEEGFVAATRSVVAIEPVEVTSGKEIIMRSGVIYFSGAATLTRGDPKKDGLFLKADSAIMRLAERDGRVAGVARIEGYDQVEFEAGQLAGGGDVLDFDYDARLVVVRARAGGRCRLAFGELLRESTSTIRFDLARSRFVTYDVEGQGTLPR